MPDAQSEQQDLLKALGHPVRRDLLRLALDADTISPKEASELLAHPLAGVSYHVRVLAACGLLRLADTQPAGGSLQHFYTLSSKVDETPWIRGTLEPRDTVTSRRQQQ
jgi:predicted transcriptional regulator